MPTSAIDQAVKVASNNLGPAATVAGSIGAETVADDGTPGNNQAQNKQVRDIVRILRLTKKQRDPLHDDISGENMGFGQILDRAKDKFGK